MKLALYTLPGGIGLGLVFLTVILIDRFLLGQWGPKLKQQLLVEGRFTVGVVSHVLQAKGWGQGDVDRVSAEYQDSSAQTWRVDVQGQLGVSALKVGDTLGVLHLQHKPGVAGVLCPERGLSPGRAWALRT